LPHWQRKSIRPFESTTNVGICVAPPYVPAETPVEPSVNGMFAFAEPSIETVPLASPETPIVRAVCHAAAVFALPYSEARTAVAENMPEPNLS
jgi:hypothetical protein